MPTKSLQPFKTQFHPPSSISETPQKQIQQTMKLHLHHLLSLILLQLIFSKSTAQQLYVNNKQLDCENNFTETEGYICNGLSKSCLSYLIFRTNPTYNSPVTVAYLLNADPSQIAKINNLTDVAPLPDDTLLIVPINCSCFSPTPSKSYYQHNTSYVLKWPSETYFSVANNTYESLTTCQAMIFQNPYNYRNLKVGMKLEVPLRCACPTKKQSDAGVKYLLSYPVAQGEDPSTIGDKFGVGGNDIMEANEIPPDHFIFFFTQILVPLKSEPKKIEADAPPPPPLPPATPSSPTGNGSGSNKTGLYIGVGVGSGVLITALLLLFFLRRRRNTRRHFIPTTPPPKATKLPQSSADYSAFPSETSNSWSISSEGIRYAIGSLTLYKFEELEKATGSFSESNKIKGSVYRASFKGDNAAVKVMRGDVSDEINILKQINHSNIIRLSGFCVHRGNTYLVYEFAENGSITEHLHRPNSETTLLSWKQRVQIAYDVADALNYLHNYTNPPYIHKNLTSSNILLDLNFRAKLSNFGLARVIVEDERNLHLTKHVVGTFGYMAPEYIENGLITPKLDVYAFGVVILELLSGREASAGKGAEGEMLAEEVRRVLGGDNVREKLREFIDGRLGNEYPLDLGYSLAEIAKSCVAEDLNERPSAGEVMMSLSKVLSSSMDWDPSLELGYSRSYEHGR